MKASYKKKTKKKDGEEPPPGRWGMVDTEIAAGAEAKALRVWLYSLSTVS